MSDKPTFTRRQFLHAGLGLVSTVTTVPTFLSRSAWAMSDTSMRTTSKPGVPEDRVLVVIQLSGGNDGLNTVVPFGSSEYFRARPRIAVPENEVLPVDLDAGLGLHPAMQPIREMMGEGLATILQGVGYPNPNRSHFASMDVWHSGDTRGARGHGWIGRALDQLHDAGEATGMDCITLGSTAPLAAQGRQTNAVAFQQPHLFRWTHGVRDPNLARTYDALQQLQLADGTQDDPTSFIFRTAMDAQLASEQVRSAADTETQTRFPGGGLSRQLEMVAKMIRAELPTRVYYVAQGGYDTHANQFNTHRGLLEQFAGSVRAFYNELKATGHRSRVVTIAFSEFGRRVRQNASQGTDHGAAAPLFIFGEHTTPGLLGEHPPMENLERGDLVYNIDFRSVYRDVLENWMRLDAEAVFARQVNKANILHA